MLFHKQGRSMIQLAKRAKRKDFNHAYKKQLNQSSDSIKTFKTLNTDFNVTTMKTLNNSIKTINI